MHHIGNSSGSSVADIYESHSLLQVPAQAIAHENLRMLSADRNKSDDGKEEEKEENLRKRKIL